MITTITQFLRTHLYRITGVDLESGLIEHITKFLLELSSGFAYLGRQVPIKVGEKDFYLDY